MENESATILLPILPDENIVAVGIEHIDMVIGGFNVIGTYDYQGKVSDFKFKFNSDWMYCNIRELEQFIQGELSRKLCPMN